MSESRTDTSEACPSQGRSEHERDHEEFQAGTGYQPDTGYQARVAWPPSSTHAGGQEAARRRGQPVRDDPADASQADSDRADGGQTDEAHTDGGDTGRGQASHDGTAQDG